MGTTYDFSSQLARLLTGIAEAGQYGIDRDIRLHSAIMEVLVELGADAVVLRIGTDAHCFAAFRPYVSFGGQTKEQVTLDVVEIANSELSADGNCSLVVGRAVGGHQSDLLYCFSNFMFRTESGRELRPQLAEFVCFLALRRPVAGVVVLPPTTQWQRLTYRTSESRISLTPPSTNVATVLARAIHFGLLQRIGTDSGLSNEISDYLWKAVDNGAQVDNLRNAGPLMTATVSLDLRRSTFTMEQSISKKIYADWIEALVILCKRLTRENDGVFDKFTGDGALIHFVANPMAPGSDEVASIRVLAKRAVKCAWELISAVNILINDLRPTLALSNKFFGPAAGVAVDYAQWSIDRARNPIVVGRGIVHACRASAGPSGKIWATNAVYENITDMYPESVVKYIEYTGKEYDREAGVQIVELSAQPSEWISRRPQLDLTCKEILNDIKAQRQMQLR